MQAQAMRTLDGIDRTLSLARAIEERRQNGLSLRSLFQSLHLGDDAPNQITVFDRDGRFVTSTDSAAQLANVPVANRDYFRAARSGNSDALIIAAPLKGWISARTVLPALKRLVSPSGEFDGIVLSALDPARLIDVYRGIELAEGEFVGVAQRDGRVIAQSTPVGGEIHYGRSTLPVSASPEPAIGWPLLDGAPYLLVTRPVPGTDLLVFLARPTSDILAGNQRLTNVVALLAGSALLAFTLPIAYTARRSLRVLRERAALEARARIDPLTQTYNRAALEDRLKLCLDALTREGESFALAFIDIDNFKALNDSRGHAEGDRALTRIAAILQASVRRTDLVARIGGDEFAVLLPAGALSATRRVFDQVMEMLRVLARRETWSISFSMGVVTYQTAPQDTSEAIAIADRVMYTVKQTTKDGVCFAVHDQRGLQIEGAAPLAVRRWLDASSASHAA
jgi:diguanylate cyclase (GGDEF)-like protein